LAKFLNDRIARFPREPIVKVTLVENYDSIGKPIFFPTEYNLQFFYETYEERLLEKARLELAV
jgi:hypothetical protein